MPSDDNFSKEHPLDQQPQNNESEKRASFIKDSHIYMLTS